MHGNAQNNITHIICDSETGQTGLTAPGVSTIFGSCDVLGETK